MTSEAPMAWAVKRLTRPIGPAPQIKTVLPKATPARWHACTPTAKGSIRAPSSRLTLSGNLKQKSAASVYHLYKNWKEKCSQNCQVSTLGPFFNYVDQILPIFDHLPTPGWQRNYFTGYKGKSAYRWHFQYHLTTHHINVVKERPHCEIYLTYRGCRHRVGLHKTSFLDTNCNDHFCSSRTFYTELQVQWLRDLRVSGV